VVVKLVFVSHATVDSELVEQFVDIILKSCGLTETDIFVSSIPGMDIPAGGDLLAAVRAEVSDTTLVIAVITPTYPTRPVCVAELGAAWGVSGKLLPVLVPGVDRDRLDGVLTGMKVDYLNQEKALDHIAERIETETGLRPVSPASWTRAKQKWLRAIDDLVAKLPRPEIISKDEHEIRTSIAIFVRELLLRPPQLRRLHTLAPDVPESQKVQKARITHRLDPGEELIAVWEWGTVMSGFGKTLDSLAFTSHGLHIASGNLRLSIPYSDFGLYKFSYFVGFNSRGYDPYYLRIHGPTSWDSPGFGRDFRTVEMVVYVLNRIKELASG
jgi:hypothetical protein